MNRATSYVQCRVLCHTHSADSNATMGKHLRSDPCRAPGAIMGAMHGDTQPATFAPDRACSVIRLAIARR